MIEPTPWQKKKRARRMYVELLAVEQRVKFNRLEQLAEAREKARKAVKKQLPHQQKRRRELTRLARARNARKRVSVQGRVPRGTASVFAGWVRILVGMEPGQWYGRWALFGSVGVRRGRLMLFLDKALNPKRPDMPLIGAAMQRYRGRKLPPPEPRYVWRLNPWGVALRAAVLREPGAKRVNVLGVEGARPDLW